MHWLLNIRIDKMSFLVPLAAVVTVVTLYLLIRVPWRRGTLVNGATAVAGALTGLVASWLVSDVWNVFGLPLTAMTRMWVAAAFAGVFLAAVNLHRTRWWRKLIATLFVPLITVAAAAGINADYGAYRNLNDAFGTVPVAALTASRPSPRAAAMDAQLGQHWVAPVGMPAHGTVGTVTIPGATSHFAARQAIIYLPPAALVPDPPTLPVVMLFAGQPGAPLGCLHLRAGRSDV